MGSTRRYDTSRSVVFWRTRDAFGGLSNMAGDYPLWLPEGSVPSSEALYQALKFPRDPSIQDDILGQANPWLAKRLSEQHAGRARKDWLSVRVNVMRWVLRVKYASWPRAFGDLLRATGTMAIVERSSRDSFWGAIPSRSGELVGTNALGRLLMELREETLETPAEYVVPGPAFSVPLLRGRRLSGGWSAHPDPRDAPPACARQLRFDG